MEFGRNLIHLLSGVILVVLLIKNILTPYTLLLLILIGFLLALLSFKIKVPIVSWFLENFEREKEIKVLPGGASILFLIGALLALMLFPLNIALASILILAFGDTFSPLIGKFGKIKYFLNKNKNLEGIFVGVGYATLVASLFVPIAHAFFGSLVAMLVEGVDIKIGKYKINDNLIIPLIAGTVIYLL